MSRRIEFVVFVLSVAVLAYLYGVGSERFGWFPTDLVDRAVTQAESLFSPPGFLTRRIYGESGVRQARPERMAPGLTLVSSVWEGEEGWKPGLRLLDSGGRTVHSWTADPERIFPGFTQRVALGLGHVDVHGAHLFPGGAVLLNLEYVGTARLDACSRVEWRLSEGGHHSIARAEDGSFWIPGVSAEPRSGTPDHPGGLPGIPEPVYHDYLLRVSPEGEVLRRIHVLDLLYQNGLHRHILKTWLGPPEDVTHLNDIEPLSSRLADEFPAFHAGDLVVSLRNLHLVFVVDPRTEKIKWHATDPFIQQHDPDFIGDGWIGIFDNSFDGTQRGTILGGSRIIALKPSQDSIRSLFPTPLSEPFYTGARGKWELLENGNLLLTESGAGRVVEVAPDGRTVWDWVVEPFDEDLGPAVSDALRVNLTPRESSDWACSPADQSH